jgi:DNA-binding winged helix-turn-helix (wHTH) protein
VTGQAPTDVMTAHDRTSRIVLARERDFMLGTLKVVPSRREVIGSSTREILEPRVMQVLVALRRASPELVCREDLIETCWQGVIVGEDAITRVISRLRKLGQTAGNAFAIQTVTKVGYRLVEQAEESTAREVERDSNHRSNPAINRRQWILGAGALAAAAGASGLAWLYRSTPNLPEPQQQLFNQAISMIRADRSEVLPEAAALLRQVLGVIPDSAEAWGYLALTLAMYRDSLPPTEGDRFDAQARQAAERALALDRENGPALTARIWNTPVFRDWLTVETAARDVIEAVPREPFARNVLARALGEVGRLRDSLSALAPFEDEAVMMPKVQWHVALSLHTLGQTDAGEEVINRAMQRWPRHPSIWFTRYFLWARGGQPERALAFSAQRSGRPNGIPDWNFDACDLETRALLTRREADVETALKRSLELAHQAAGFATNTIIFAAQVGRLEEAFAVADGYYFGRGFGVAATTFTREQGGFTPPYRRSTRFLWWKSCQALRADPRFRGLLEETQLTSYWRRSGTRPDIAY